MVELQPSKLEVASSNLVSRSIFFASPDVRTGLTASHRMDGRKDKAHVAQSVERFLGKEEVHRFDSGRGLHSANIRQRSTPLRALIG